LVQSQLEIIFAALFCESTAFENLKKQVLTAYEGISMHQILSERQISSGRIDFLKSFLLEENEASLLSFLFWLDLQDYQRLVG
jgi:hypothetical protein